MADVIRKATNKFTKGLVIDFSPENTQAEVLTHALNATLLTFNGNELSLQNDMGNARVETAFLPEGYMPVGTCEYGGIIYIVSYNPLEDKSQIGCFPSPERNVSHKELGETNQSISNRDFQGSNGELVNNSKFVLLKKDKLNPGDKFIVCADPSICDEQLENLLLKKTGGSYEPIGNPILSLNVVSIEDSGKIVYLNTDLRHYDFNNCRYHILGTMSGQQEDVDIDSYRNTLSSGFNVFRSKTSGKLAILAELIMIDSYSVTHSIEPQIDETTQQVKEGCFDVIIHTEVEPTVLKENYTTIPKLRYYYLKNSQGYLQMFDKEGNSNLVPMFTKTSNGVVYNSSFGDTKLSDIYQPTTDLPLELDVTLNSAGKFNFPEPDTYHGSTGNVEKFIPNEENDFKYDDVKLASISIPEVVYTSQLTDLPFKYDYTLVPCMSYGKLNHLSVSNTVDFSKLHAFSQSSFNVWKYRIDGNQLRLTFGAEVFDMYETDKVDALVLEFYDLWGFAGSVEITGKKSYNGVFTKIITLDSLNGVDSKKVGDDDYIYNYSRNINIKRDKDNKLWYGSKKVLFDSKVGWLYEDETPLQDSDNDCGTLYSNIVYGVKAYFRIDKKGTKSFIKKRDLFLFTLPIYNDFYYTINDFDTLYNPKLDLVLTHKLVDSSSRQVYNEEQYVNGYNPNHIALIEKYNEGSLENITEFDVIKYIKYAGATNINLEIGLKSDYQDFNLRYDPSINNYYTCTLVLSNDSGEGLPYDLKQGDTIVDNKELVLNYIDDEQSLNVDVNKIGFEGDFNTTYPIESNLRVHNFLNGYVGTSIPLNYEFVVGYKTHVTDISETAIPATTVCALCHKRDDGEYNYDDFGLYEKDGELFSEEMFFNEGNKSEEVFGLCRMINADDDVNIITQCEKYNTKRIEATKHPLNTGEPVKEILANIGKLVFCMPHAHGLSDSNGVNVTKNRGITPDVTAGKDVSSGIVGAPFLFEKPEYNSALITKNLLNYGTPFRSTMDYATDQLQTWVVKSGISSFEKVTESDDKYEMRLFKGLSGKQLLAYNKALMTTMKSVYAYNPDYDSLYVNIGKVSVDDLSVQFTSNLLSQDSQLDFPEGKCFSDYLYFGSISVSDYFKCMDAYSNDDNPIYLYKDGKLLSQISFTPNLEYCGEKDQPLLLSTLTYNLPVYNEVIDELNYSKADTLLIRHEDGKIDSIDGVIDKNSLYGYYANGKKLVKLDVSNYTIGTEGILQLKQGAESTSKKGTHNFTVQKDENRQSKFMYVFYDGEVKIQVNIGIADGNGSIIASKNNSIILYRDGEYEKGISLKVEATCKSEEKGYTYSVEVENISMTVTGVLLHPNVFQKGSGKFPGNNVDYPANIGGAYTYGSDYQDFEILKQLAYNSSSYLILKHNDGSVGYEGQSRLLWSNKDSKYQSMRDLQNFQKINFKVYDPADNTQKASSDTLMHVTLNSISYTIIRQTDLDFIKESVISTTRTQTYTQVKEDKYYKLLEKYAGAAFRYSSLTINDLEYIPTEEHRLFVRNNLTTEQTSPRNILYYRGLEAVGTWHADTAEYNGLHLYTGPCFVPPNG